MNWYIVQAYSGFEKKVVEAIKKELKKNNFSNNLEEILVPTHQVTEVKKGKRTKKEKKFFPGYVLVNMELNDDSWHLVKDTPRVMGFIGGTKEKPSPLSNVEAQGIMQQLEQGSDITKPKVSFEPGEMVRVVDGPFNDFSGVVEEVNYEKS